ncbi:OsmC family protein [Flavilitoribacter nigricans]|uniref:Osmotically inducible protein C n=1 Tax=Flavilitoribacter nigricans (strain ATCC 23147 / DSM 23189 / NBRC 102662 / NCIMB 1420 / SS-2) TaxID=1122177 RepID=A0A2D0NAC4_FLAN2|nr:OsmC family protein [Flavilitoribacter nigricans]PHN05119.1 osmotically inducible protein C [Flavilitoribacter nigricans DSM 23189 = NBRC 102662]
MEVSSKAINGINQDAIGGTVVAIQENPAIAHFEFRATNTWMGGAHTRSYVQGFYGAGQEDTSRAAPFIYDHDEPPVLLGSNNGANPGEVLLYGLLSCMTTAMIILATARGIELKAVSSKIEGDVDLRGFLGLDPSVKKEFSQIRVTFDIDGVDEATKMELITLAKQSPVFNSLINPVDVQVDLA